MRRYGFAPKSWRELPVDDCPPDDDSGACEDCDGTGHVRCADCEGLRSAGEGGDCEYRDTHGCPECPTCGGMSAADRAEAAIEDEAEVRRERLRDDKPDYDDVRDYE